MEPGTDPVRLLLEELDTIDLECIEARYENSRDMTPCEPERRHWDAPDPTFRITNGTSFDDLPLAQVAFALASSRDSRTGPGSTRISLHGKRFHDHARCVLGRGAVELVCHWFNCNPEDAVRFSKPTKPSSRSKKILRPHGSGLHFVVSPS